MDGCRQIMAGGEHNRPTALGAASFQGLVDSSGFVGQTGSMDPKIVNVVGLGGKCWLRKPGWRKWLRRCRNSASKAKRQKKCRPEGSAPSAKKNHKHHLKSERMQLATRTNVQ